MPGKGDYGSGANFGLGQYFPGSNEYRAWSEAFIARYALQERNTNPFNQAELPAEWKAWDDGWVTADGNTTGQQYMPAVPAGPPGAIPP